MAATVLVGQRRLTARTLADLLALTPTQFEQATPAAALVVSPSRAAGSSVVIIGFGFQPGERVNVSFNGSSIGTPTADTSGSFSLSFTVPNLAPGQYHVVASGQTTGVSQTASFAIVAATPAANPTAHAPAVAHDDRYFSQTGYRANSWRSQGPPIAYARAASGSIRACRGSHCTACGPSRLLSPGHERPSVEHCGEMAVESRERSDLRMRGCVPRAPRPGSTAAAARVPPGPSSRLADSIDGADWRHPSERSRR